MASAILDRIEKLRAQIEHHTHLYYVAAQPEISDQQFDKLMRELIALEADHPETITADSPTQRVGGEISSTFATIEHAVPMMSIDNTYDETDLRAFDARVHKALGEAEEVAYVLEPKVDGVSLGLRYEKGTLTLAATRGDGRRGDDVTPNARTISSIPMRLGAVKGERIPDVLEVRGEVYMSNAEFQKLNKSRESAGEETYKNPRNLTTGALRQLDPKVTASRKLRFVAHGLGQVDSLAVQTYWDWVMLLKKWRFPVGENTTRAQNIDEAIKAIEQFQVDRGQLAYQTDGMVVKVDLFAQRDKLGVTSKSPRWVIAYKYAAEQMQTVLKAVDWQVGKGGTLTPVARLEPVFLAGTTVQNASLHNIEQIERLDIHLGDTVVLEKAGEVIPYIRQAVPDKRPAGAKAIVPPATCPSCNAPVEKEADTPYIRCINPDCPAQLKERIRWYCGRNQMDIEHVGDKLVDALVDAKLLRSFADLYRLSQTQLRDIERLGEKSAKNIVDAIEKSRANGLDRLLAGLGIRHVGNRVARILAENFGSFDKLKEATVQQLSDVSDIGAVIAASVHDFFHNPAGIHVIDELKDVGIDPTMKLIEGADRPRPFAGMSIVVTGTLPTLDRAQIEQMILGRGGKASGSVSKKTAFVVAGESAGSKLDKARTLGVEVIDEAEFVRRAGETL